MDYEYIPNGTKKISQTELSQIKKLASGMVKQQIRDAQTIAERDWLESTLGLQRRSCTYHLLVKFLEEQQILETFADALHRPTRVDRAKTSKVINEYQECLKACFDQE